MRVIDSLTTFLQKSVSKAVTEIGGVRIYAFGSALVSPTPRDIDLLIVFDPAKVHIDTVLGLRRHICRSGSIAFSVSFDICLLTEGEARNNRFLEEEHATLLCG